MDCHENWQDVFITRPEYGGTGQATINDDIFVASVMSVKLQIVGQTDVVAKAVEEGTNWLTLAFPANATSDEVSQWNELKVGDMIRVGVAGSQAFTDYVTILEILDADKLIAAEAWQISAHDPAEASLPDKKYIGSTYGDYNHKVRCVRINYSIDASTLPLGKPDDVFANHTAIITDILPRRRGDVSTFYTLSGTRNYEGASRREMFFYPCYKQRDWVQTSANTVLKLHVPTNIKHIRAIKLMGYSMMHKRRIGVQQQHEHQEDDWYALRIKELNTNNNVLSNNQHANGALHVIATGKKREIMAGSDELYEYDPHGLACASFSPINLPAITVQVVDRLGREAHFGRMHLWLRVLVTRG